MQLRTRTRSERRSAFTIIELLVVIVIIFILMGILLPAIQRVIITKDEAEITTEIKQLEQSCEAFRTIYHRYPPGRIRLIENPTPAAFYDSANAFDMYSVDYLRTMFPAIYITLDAPSATNPAHTHNWDGSTDAAGAPTIQSGAAGDRLLQGDECLVYFLGGIPQVDAAGIINTFGFCTDKSNPTLLNAITRTQSRDGPFFEFKSDRLRINLNNQYVANRGNFFPVYLDRFGAVPYAYFLARYGTQNNYPCNLVSGTVPPPNVSDSGALMVANGSGPSSSAGFSPYCSALPKTVGTAQYFSFHKSDKFMIISAGRDRIFGSGGLYDPNDPDQLADPRDKDNIGNFSSGKLGG